MPTRDVSSLDHEKHEIHEKHEKASGLGLIDHPDRRRDRIARQHHLRRSPHIVPVLFSLNWRCRESDATWRHSALNVSYRPALRAIGADPSIGAPLERELKELWRFRVRRFRIVYAIDRSRRTVRVMAVAHRRHIYDDLAQIVRRT